MQTKKCAHCQSEISISLFSRNRNKKDGLQDYCKKCDQIKHKKYYYNKNHQEQKQIYGVHQREKQQQNPLFINDPEIWYFNQVKRAASKRKNCLFNLDYQDILLIPHKQCCFCGIKIKFTKTFTQASGNQNASLDRINSSKGYEVGNIQWSCWKCNRLKSTFSQDDFIHLCNLIAKQHPEL